MTSIVREQWYVAAYGPGRQRRRSRPFGRRPRGSATAVRSVSPTVRAAARGISRVPTGSPDRS